MPTALIIEDEPEANRLLCLLVQLRGYRTVSALTGGEGLEAVRRDVPDVVFLDLMLPDFDGYEICRTLKARKETVLIPVVIVTARLAAQNRLQSFALGADGYVPKPYTPDQIFEALDDARVWSDTVTGGGTTGKVLLASRDNGESHRRLARLRNLFLGRTPVAPDAIEPFWALLQRLGREADAWGERQGRDEVAALRYQIEPDRIELTLRDLSGWFDGAGLAPPFTRWSDDLRNAGIDPEPVRNPGDVVSFARPFPPVA